jgi:hypothetical protein
MMSVLSLLSLAFSQSSTAGPEGPTALREDPLRPLGDLALHRRDDRRSYSYCHGLFQRRLRAAID